MKINNALKMDIETRVEKDELVVSIGVDIEKDLAELMTSEDIERVEELITEVSSIFNKTIVRDIEENTSIKLSKGKSVVVKDEDDKKKMEDKMQELYDKLDEESKAKADKLHEDLQKLRNPEEKAKRVLEEILNNIFEI